MIAAGATTAPSNGRREVVADVAALVAIAAGIGSHFLVLLGLAPTGDAFLDATALIGLTYLGISGSAAKTANGGAIVAADTRPRDDQALPK